MTADTIREKSKTPDSPVAVGRLIQSTAFFSNAV